MIEHMAMTADRLVGKIERVEASIAKLIVSGWIEHDGANPQLSLMLDGKEIADQSLSTEPVESRAVGRIKRRCNFSFRVPFPLKLTDVRSLSVQQAARAGRITAMPGALTGTLPTILALDDVVPERNGTRVLWRQKRGGKDRGQPRILFEASSDNGVVHGIALDLDDSEHALCVEVMAGTRRIAQFLAREQAEVETSIGPVAVACGFLYELPDDAIAESDLWFAIGELQRVTFSDAAIRAVRLNAYEPVENPDQEHSRFKPSLIVVAGENAEALKLFLGSIRKTISSSAGELIVVDPSGDREVEKVCRAGSGGWSVRRIAESPLASLSTARNAGARVANGDLLVFVDLSLEIEVDSIAEACRRFAQDEIGAAGIRIAHKVKPVDGRDENEQLGVHFLGKPGESGLFAIRSGNDSEFAAARSTPVCIPAVDSRFLICRAELFHSLGGFNKDLPKELAVADLCLRIRGLSREVVSFNDLNAFSREEPKAIPSPGGRPFSSIARQVRRDLFDRVAFWSGRPPRIGIVFSSDLKDREFAEQLAAAIEAVVPSYAKVMAPAERDVSDFDALIVFDPAFDLRTLMTSGAVFSAFAWVRREAERWKACDWSDAFHGFIAASTEIASKLECIGRPLEIISEQAAVRPSAREALDQAKADKILSIELAADPASGTLAGRSEAGGMAVVLGRSASGAQARDLQGYARAFLSCYRRQTRALRFAIKTDDGDIESDTTAYALARAISRMGHVARVDPPDQWRHPLTASDDCILALRGCRAYQPNDDQVHLLWITDRPDLVCANELVAYEHIFVSAAQGAKIVQQLTDVPVSFLPPAIDVTFQLFTETSGGSRRALLLVGDAQDCYESLLDAVRLGLDVTVWGSGWDEAIPLSVVRSQRVKIATTKPDYREFEIAYVPASRLGRKFGAMAPPLLEAMAAGTKVITENAVGENIPGSLVRAVDVGTPLATAIESWRAETPSERANRLQTIRDFMAENSVAQRARVIVNVASELINRTSPCH